MMRISVRRANNRAASCLRPPMVVGMSVAKYAHDDVKSSTEWPARAVLAVATQCAPECLGISAVLDCDQEYNRAVASRAIGRAVALVIVQKKLAGFPIR